MVEFEWDDKKAEENWRKHGIRFEEAKEVFNDPLAKRELNRIENGEDRYQVVGRTKSSILLMVIHTIQENGITIVRIISARRTTRQERRKYEFG